MNVVVGGNCACDGSCGVLLVLEQGIVDFVDKVVAEALLPWLWPWSCCSSWREDDGSMMVTRGGGKLLAVYCALSESRLSLAVFSSNRLSGWLVQVGAYVVEDK